MWPNPQFPADLVTFTEDILNGKLILQSLTAKSQPNIRDEGNICYITRDYEITIYF